MRWVLCVEEWREDTGGKKGGEWMDGGTGYKDEFGSEGRVRGKDG